MDNKSIVIKEEKTRILLTSQANESPSLRAGGALNRPSLEAAIDFQIKKGENLNIDIVFKDIKKRSTRNQVDSSGIFHHFILYQCNPPGSP